MARAPFQVIVFPYRFGKSGQLEYAIFFRLTERYGDFWQAISGGGEDDETPLQTARRETWEETGLDPNADFIQLDMLSMLPADAAVGYLMWGEDVLAVPEYAFGMHAGDQEISLSNEHESYQWASFQAAHDLLRWDSNKHALWELDMRLRRRGSIL